MSTEKDIQAFQEEKLIQRPIYSFFGRAPTHSAPPLPPTKTEFPPYNPKRDYKYVKNYVKNKISSSFDSVHTWQGYCFIASNNFREYKIINTIPRPDRFTNQVYQPGLEVGSATIDDDSALTNIEVIIPFRGKGLGTELIKFMNNCCEQFHVFAGTGENSRYQLTEEGAGFIKSCKQKGILDEEQVILNHVPPSPSLTGY